MSHRYIKKLHDAMEQALQQTGGDEHAAARLMLKQGWKGYFSDRETRQRIIEEWLWEGFPELAQKQLGITLRVVRHSDKPDFHCELVCGEEVLSVGVDLVEFRSGLGKGGSKDREFEERWTEVAHKISEQIQKHPQRSRLQHVGVNLYLHSKRLPNRSEEDQFIQRALSFVSSVFPRLTRSLAQFDEFPDPILQKYVRQMDMVSGDAIMGLWQCANAQVGFVGISRDELRTILKDKSLKSANYRVKGFDKVGLLIVAPGLSLSGHAACCQAEWQAEGLVGTMQKSGFDFIWFYDHTREQVTTLYSQASWSKK